MQIIEAFLAFAVTMLILSMVASSITELFHRILRTRAEGFKRQIDQLYDDVLVPYALNAVGAAAKARDILKQDWAVREEIRRRGQSAHKSIAELLASDLDDLKAFDALPDAEAMREAKVAIKRLVVNALTESRVVDRLETGLFAPLLRTFGSNVPSITPAEFIERLAAGPLGEAIEARAAVLASQGAADLDASRNEVTSALARRFESYGTEMSLWFENRARLVSVTAGLLIAWVVHVDATVLMRGFMNDPALARAIASRADDVTARAEQTLNVRVKEIVRRQETVAAPQGSASEHQPQDDSTAQQGAVPDQAAQDIRSEVRTALDTARAQIRDLTTAGLPFGWRDGVNGVVATNLFGIPIWRPTSSNTFVGLVLGGLLIGLGAPFWYKAVQTLVAFRKTVGLAGEALSGGAASPGVPPGSATSPAPGASAGGLQNLFRMALGQPNQRRSPPGRGTP